jgi:hypothetical protein
MEPISKLATLTTATPADDGFTKELILLDAKEFKNNSFYIDKIVGVWVNGNEARVRTELRSRKFERQLAQRDFLLFKAKGEWRIFLIDTRSLVNVYGMSEVEYVK